MNLTEQDVKCILQALAQRPLAEALPTFLKLTKQKLVPEAPQDKENQAGDAA